MSTKSIPTCVICGKKLENPESIERGMGEVCARKYANFAHVTTKRAKRGSPYSNTPQFSYSVININGERVAVVIDESDGEVCPSVTNAIEMVSNEIGIKKIIYRDTMGNWDFWSFDSGFKPLGVNGEPTKDMDKAIEVAKARYFGKGLFA